MAVVKLRFEFGADSTFWNLYAFVLGVKLQRISQYGLITDDCLI